MPWQDSDQHQLELRQVDMRGVSLKAEDRICQFCDLNEPETEEHVITRCDLYNDIRDDLYVYVVNNNNDIFYLK